MGSEPSMSSAFIQIMRDRNEISVYEAKVLIAKITGKMMDSIHNSTFDQSHLYNNSNFFNDYGIYLRGDETILAKRSYADKKGIVLLKDLVDYNTMEKAQARELVFKNIGLVRRPKIVTLPNRNGYDVDLIKKLNPTSIIYCVERYEHIFNEYIKKCKFKGIKFYRGLIHKFLHDHRNHTFDVIFYDCHSYWCPSMFKDLQLINQMKMTHEIGITLVNIKQVRNHGKWFDQIRKQYADVPDQQQLALMFDVLTNYKCIGQLSYRGCNKGRKKNMVLYQFQLT